MNGNQYEIIGVNLDQTSSYQHSCPEVVFVKKLRDEDVHLEHVGHVLLLDVAQHIHEPLEGPLRRRDPQKVDLKNSKPIRFNHTLPGFLITFLHATPEYLLVDVPKTRSLRMEA